MSENVGSIEYVAGISTDKLRRDSAEAEKIAKQTGDGIGNGLEAGESRGSQALSKLGTAAKVASIAMGVALAGGIASAAKASWDQVGAVEQATVGLRAYESDVNKVNSVLNSLVAYARSDMGVLFNRKDLFQSAQMLKLNGVATDDLSKDVQILSRSVGLGLGNWQDLNRVIGRVVSTGRLSGEEMDLLTQSGFKLDKSLRNTNISATDLFKALDKGIPVNAMEGQANTIQGLGIRLQTAFRGVGDAILGVDADSGKFIEGGLGNRLVLAMGNATLLLKGLGKTFRDIIPDIQAVVGQIGEYLGPKLQALWTTITTQLIPAVSNFAKAFGPTAGAGLVGLIGLAITALNIFLAVLTPVLNYLSENTWIVWAVVGAFVAFQTALLISSAVSAFQTGIAAINVAMALASTQAVGTTGLIAGLRVALALMTSGPWVITITLVAIGVLIAIKEISDALDKLLDKWSKTGQAQAKLGKGDVSVSGNSSVGLTQQLMNAFQNFGGARASGGPVSSGKAYIVGENRPEIFVPSTSGTIIPEIPELTSGNSSGPNINISVNMQGIMTRSKSDEREIAKSLIRRVNEELTAKGSPALGGGMI